jgi:hypothetical protein
MPSSLSGKDDTSQAVMQSRGLAEQNSIFHRTPTVIVNI